MEATGDFCRLHIRVKFNAKHGQMVAVSGLGGTEDLDAIRLVTTPEAYPIWYTKSPIVLPRTGFASYKYCIIEDGSVKSYESTHYCRTVPLSDADMIVEDEFEISDLENFDKSSLDLENLDYSAIKRRGSELEQNVWTTLASRNSRLLIVCYHLPVSIKRTNKAENPFEITWAESIIAKTLGSVSGNVPTFWFGTISVSIKDVSDVEKEALTNMLKQMNCIPIFLDDEVADAAYSGFCKTVMWPVFHNVDQLDQIHAAWNLPEELLSGTPTNRSGAPTPLNANTPVSSAKEKESSSVLEWNKREMAYHEAYKQVNKTFADTILSFVHKEDVVWVHDYHLMLVPKYLRHEVKQRNDLDGLKTIFFLHIPFPTSQIFRTLPEATELLQSMVSADLVGFHAFDHARHFLNAAKRMLGIRSNTREGGMLTLSVQDREVVIAMSHVSIEAERIDEVLRDPTTMKLVDEYKAKYGNKKIVLGIDVCQRLSGLALKMSAFEKLIADYHVAGTTHSTSNSIKESPMRQERVLWNTNSLDNTPNVNHPPTPSERHSNSRDVILIQRSIRQGNRCEDEETTSNDMKKLVHDLNAKYAPYSASSLLSHAQSSKSSGVCTMIDYQEVTGLTLQQRVALYLIADVFFSTPIREGLNLMPLEYIYSRSNQPRAGVIVASEFSTCSCLLNGSLKVNPFAPHAVADILDKALHMSKKECEYRKQRDLPFVISHPSALWTKQILQELEELRYNVGHGRMMKRKVFPAPLRIPDMVDAYQFAAREKGLSEIGTRVFIFDYGGTLLAKEKFDIYIKQTISAISGRRPPESMLTALKQLSDDPLNIVVVITGLTKAKVINSFVDMPNITLATSHGLVYSWGENLRNAISNATTSTYTTSATPVSPTTPSTTPFTTAVSSGAGAAGASVGEDGRKWEYLDGNIDWHTVTEIAGPIITKFTNRTNGTCQTPRFPGIGWSFFGADPEWGSKQSQQLHVSIHLF